MRRFWFEFEAGTLAQLEELGLGYQRVRPGGALRRGRGRNWS